MAGVADGCCIGERCRGSQGMGRSSDARSAACLYVMYNSMRFEWDAKKNQSNRKKHAGMDFETASRVFADLILMLRKDA